MIFQPPSDPAVPIFVINLDRDVTRLRYLETLFARHGLSFERIEAVDGRRLPELRGPEIVPVCFSPRFPRGLSMKEQALTMSHRKAALRMLASGAPVACIMEDDVGFGLAFQRLLPILMADPPADIVKLEGIGTVRRVVPVSTVANCVLAVTANPIMGAAGYLATRRGAQCIVDLTETVKEPFDHVLADLVGRVSLVHVLPYPVHQRPEAWIVHPDQLIVDKRPINSTNRLAREFVRNKRHALAAIDIIRRFPRRALCWRRIALQEKRGID